MMENEPLAPYDQNKLSNHILSIAKCNILGFLRSVSNAKNVGFKILILN
jgi:hypothetical protein